MVLQAPAQQHSQRQGAAVWLAIAALVAAAGYRWVSQNSSKQAAVPPQPDPDVGQLGDPSDTKEYQKALARTRQAVSVHKALGFMTAGTPARAMVELKRALNENAIVREPLLNARYEKKQLQDLYRLHVQNSEMPLQFSTLLQLREMLALPDNEAEALEAEVMNSGVQFSI
ncbi:hypothetical protein WJX72_011066 [[Myrmecia] bisecta]|uniref:Uncharacterized protein n=1 Tax=[Myrmecia] bisecta TaxID=41462 RepID=A0AAW1P5F6_9CHLO